MTTRSFIQASSVDEAVALVQMFQDVDQRLLGLLQFLAFHRARGVQDQEHVFFHDLATVHLDLGRDQHHEEAVGIPVSVT